jgi:hypothetical protein
MVFESSTIFMMDTVTVVGIICCPNCLRVKVSVLNIVTVSHSISCFSHSFSFSLVETQHQTRAVHGYSSI